MQFGPRDESECVPIVEDGHHVCFSERYFDTAYIYRNLKNSYLSMLN